MDICEDLKTWRRALHQIPEEGLREYKTTAYIKEVLEKMGYTPISILETGALVYIDYGKDEAIAFRADIDGLSITENTNCEFASKHHGFMHACGHDGHTSVLLGLAKILRTSKEEMRYNIVLIFQPAEENPGGAKLLMEKKIFEQYHVKAVFGLHVMPTIEEGVIACRPGPLMAQNGELNVEIHGQSAHAGLYHLGVDTIVIASSLITQYQNIMSRFIAPSQQAVLHIGKIQAGSARNIVSDYTKMEGTIRVFDEQVFANITKAIGEIHKAAENIYGCKITWDCLPMYPPVINDKGLYKAFIKCLDTPYVELEEPLMLAEDFSYYQKEVPGIFFFLGTKTATYSSGLHTETFNFNEEVLQLAVHTFYRIATTIQLGREYNELL